MSPGIAKLVRGVQPTRSGRQPPPHPLKGWKVKGEGPFFCLEERSSDWLIVSQKRGTGNRNKQRKLTLESWETETTDLSSSKQANRLRGIPGPATEASTSRPVRAPTPGLRTHLAFRYSAFSSGPAGPSCCPHRSTPGGCWAVAESGAPHWLPARARRHLAPSGAEACDSPQSSRSTSLHIPAACDSGASSGSNGLPNASDWAS